LRPFIKTLAALIADDLIATPPNAEEVAMVDFAGQQSTKYSTELDPRAAAAVKEDRMGDQFPQTVVAEVQDAPGKDVKRAPAPAPNPVRAREPPITALPSALFNLLDRMLDRHAQLAERVRQIELNGAAKVAPLFIGPRDPEDEEPWEEEEEEEEEELEPPPKCKQAKRRDGRAANGRPKNEHFLTTEQIEYLIDSLGGPAAAAKLLGVSSANVLTRYRNGEVGVTRAMARHWKLRLNALGTPWCDLLAEVKT
jgi:hypothetical protein